MNWFYKVLGRGLCWLDGHDYRVHASLFTDGTRYFDGELICHRCGKLTPPTVSLYETTKHENNKRMG